MSTAGDSGGSSAGRGAMRAAQVIIVSSVMFTFISYWRTAAVVLCDLASTAYYIGGIVEQAIGPAAPFFILGVLLLSFFVGLVYIESCSMFVRGGVYRVVREALGPLAGKLAVSALMFDYILTGPISGVSAGQYIIGLLLDTLQSFNIVIADPVTKDLVRRWGSVAIACAIVLYFYRQNVRGLHESSNRALQIMVATTVMGVVMLAWCGTTLVVQGPAPGNRITAEPKLAVHDLPDAGPQLDKDHQHRQEDPLGLLPYLLPKDTVEQIREPVRWLSILGFIGLFIAFGHSILAMSGLETLAQVYREVESPKLPNFKKAAFIVFLYALILTGGISFLAILLIPESVRMSEFRDNLIGGLAMNVMGPHWARLLLNAFVTVVGFAILAGAANTAIIGSNGVLNRVAEDGVLPDWFQRPHPRYGTTYRVLNLIVGMQLATIIASQGNMFLLGEAYAFGVIWSFVFQAFSMLVLRFRDSRLREFRVPLNIRIGKLEIPVLLILIFLFLLATALLNLVTKVIATAGGLLFGGAFFAIFYFTERHHRRMLQGAKHEHLEQFNRQATEEITPESLRLTMPYRKLVAIRSPQNLFMLEKALAETDPDTTDVVVMTAKLAVQGDDPSPGANLDRYDQQLMTAVVNRAEKAGKQIKPLIVPTNNPLHAILHTAQVIGAQEVVLGASNKFTAEEQLDQLAFYWISLHSGHPGPLTVRVLSRNRDVYFDLEGGNRIPKISEVQARTVAELRAAGVGVDRVLLFHDATPAGSDVFQAVLTMLDPQVVLDLAVAEAEIKAQALPEPPPQKSTGGSLHLPPLAHDQEQARKLGREIELLPLNGDWGNAIVQHAQEGKYDLIIVPVPPGDSRNQLPPWVEQVRQNATCPVALFAPAVIPREVDV